MAYLRWNRIEKIVLSGLSLVGTTTVAYSLRKGIAPPKSLIQHSTIDYVSTSISIGKMRIDIFDLGGQTAFQDKFIGDLAVSELIFSGIRSFIFVVDSVEIRDISRAKYYFDLSLKRISQFSPTASIFIFLHKFDLVPKSLQQDLQQTFTQYLTAGVTWDIGVYCTSIFDPSGSLRRANKAILSKILEKQEFTESEGKDFWLFLDEKMNQEAEPDYVKKCWEEPSHVNKLFSLSLQEGLKILQEKD